MSKPERIRINHKGGGIARAAIALESIFDAFFRWAADCMGVAMYQIKF